MTHEGEACGKCPDGIVHWKFHGSGWKPKEKQPYYYKRWLYCGKCGAVFHFENEKVWLKGTIKNKRKKHSKEKKSGIRLHPTLRIHSSPLLKQEDDIPDDGEVPW